MIKRFIILFISTLLFHFCGSQVLADTLPKREAPLFDHLSSLHHPIRTTVPLAQQYFDQGLALAYSFEWGEAIRSFKEAVRLDPQCAMCYWGLALSLGYAIEIELTHNEYRDARQALTKGFDLILTAPPPERAYLEALALRFQHPPQNPENIKAFGFLGDVGENASPSEKSQYSDAMKALTERFPDDIDAKALYAYSLFDSMNWRFWVNGEISAKTPALIDTLQSILETDNNHLGGNHYYVHVMEQSPNPEEALPNANLLKTLVPLSEHLTHMPVHIYFLTGRYHEASESNQKAIEAYQNYTKACKDQGFQPVWTYLYVHNFDFLRTTAAMEGRRQLTLDASHQLAASIPDASIAMDARLQWILTVPYFMEARFGLWDAILKEPMPKADYHYATGILHYARGMAFAHQKNIVAAKQELSALTKITDENKASFMWFVRSFYTAIVKILHHDKEAAEKNRCHCEIIKLGYPILHIAVEVLTATIANFEGDEASLISHLQAARDLQAESGYHEPPLWYFPVQEALGDAYLKWHHPKEAIEAYSADLKQYPLNGWALSGLATSEHQLGMEQEAKATDEAFKKAWQYADVAAPYRLFN